MYSKTLVLIVALVVALHSTAQAVDARPKRSVLVAGAPVAAVASVPLVHTAPVVHTHSVVQHNPTSVVSIYNLAFGLHSRGV